MTTHIQSSSVLQTVDSDVSPQQVGQFREFSKIYNAMSEICFNQCVWDFGTTEIRNREDRCAMNCTEKYMKASKELGSAFTDGHPANSSS